MPKHWYKKDGTRKAKYKGKRYNKKKKSGKMKC